MMRRASAGGGEVIMGIKFEFDLGDLMQIATAMVLAGASYCITTARFEALEADVAGLERRLDREPSTSGADHQ